MEIRLLVPAVAKAAYAAREALHVLDERVPPPAIDDIRLAISEVVTNAVVHADTSAVEIRVTASEDCVTVEVDDRGKGFKPGLSPEPVELQEYGWGLYLVESVSDRWGVTVGDGTHVWFEIALDRYQKTSPSQRTSRT